MGITKVLQVLILAAALVAVTSMPASAGDGLSLVTACRNAQDIWSDKPGDAEAFNGFHYCSGIVNGVVGALTMIANSMTTSERHRFGICNPHKEGAFIPTEQAIRVVNKYLAENPEELGAPDVVLVLAALKEAFPCPQS